MSDYDDYLDVIDEIKKIDIIQTPRYRMCCYSLLDFLKAVCYLLKNILKNLSNINERGFRRKQ